MMSLTRAVPLAVPLAAVLAAVLDAASGESATEFESDIRPILERSCYACHNPGLRNADLDLTSYSDAAGVAADADTWEKVAVRIRTRVMPSEPFPPLADAEVETVTSWIESTLAHADALAAPNPGRVTARRLNRAEYNNTIRDLLGVSLRPADDFPQDDTGYGFDNNGDVLSLSPTLFEKYMLAAERVARAAVFGPAPPEPARIKLDGREGKHENSETAQTDYDETGLSLPNASHTTYRFPYDGEYVLRAVIGGERPAGSEPVEIGLFLDEELVDVVEIDPDGLGSFSRDNQDFAGLTAEVRTRVSAGERQLAAAIIRMYEGLPASYEGPNPSTRPLPPMPEFKVRPEDSPEKTAERQKQFEERLAKTPPANGVRVWRMEVTGPFDVKPGPSADSLRKLHACDHLDGGHGPGCARKTVTRLARRAYRRAVDVHDVAPLMGLVTDARRRGDSYDESLRLAIQALLVSPDFLFRIERGLPRDEGPGRRLSDHELASRLSYFLWSSMPDDTLLDLADRNVLSLPEAFDAEVTRMLADPRVGALVEAFGGQWLQFRALESVAPDEERFPQFSDYLRSSMRRETELFFGRIVRENRSILELLDGRETFLNERLAQHYGIDGVKGPEFRRVDLGAGARGGVLTHASVLTVSSYATRTSPVLRGKWILENILNAPPPDPPAGVPRLDEKNVGAEAPLREQLEAHRSNPSCAACHEKMDPLGFSLENFDAVGAWRDKDGKWDIDNSGVLPDGRTFEGPQGLRSVLSADRGAFAAAVTDKLLTYALGRGLERYDRRAVKTIAARLEEQDYRFSALVLEIARSLPFQRRLEEEAS